MNNLFRPVLIEGDLVGIPIYSSNDGFVWTIWKKNESVMDFFKNNLLKFYGEKSGLSYTCFRTWPVGDGSGEYSEIEFTVYEMKCYKSNEPYFILIYDELFDFDYIKHSIALPHNKFNLLLFINSLSNLSGKPYVYGD